MPERRETAAASPRAAVDATGVNDDGRGVAPLAPDATADRRGGSAPRRWCVTGSAGALAALAPLIEARTAAGPVAVIGAGAALPDDAGAVLRIGGPAPRQSRAAAGDGGPVVVGWLPEADGPSLERFAGAAARVLQRAPCTTSRGPVALLAQWDDRALALADELEARLGPAAMRWTAERVARRDLVEGLGCGVAAALYVGHAEPWGWVGYGGVTADVLAGGVLEPLGCVLSIACDTAAARDEGASFCEALPLAGACAAALGARTKTLHEANRALAHAVCAALSASGSLADLLLAVPETALDGYVVCGDPAAPIAGALAARQHTAKLYAPAPDEPLALARGWPAHLAREGERAAGRN